MPLQQSSEINEIIYRHMQEICPDDRIVKNVVSGASGDVGDLGYLLPTVQFGFSGIKGRIHSKPNLRLQMKRMSISTQQR